MMHARKMLKIASFVFVTLLVVGYAAFALYPYLRGPVITVTNPQNGATVTSPDIRVQGIAKGVNYLYLDDRQIFTDEAGRFSESLILYPGYNILVVRALDHFKRTTEERIEVVLQPLPLP